MTRTATDEVLLEMLREGTGKHLLDSGGESDRFWQKNRMRDLEGEAPAVVSFRRGEITFAHRLYHWLRERLEFDAEATAAFDGPFLEECDRDDDKSWGELREDFPAWYARHRSIADTKEDCSECDGAGGQCEACGGTGTLVWEDLYEAYGIYGEGEPVTVNSYNEENLLDQVILFSYFDLRAEGSRDGNAFIVLQVHGGCDVRGGYTRPRIFRVRDDELAIFDFRTGAIICSEDREHEWTTDDGHHWYFQGACGHAAGTQLEAYECRMLAEDGADVAEDEAREWVRGMLCVTSENDGLCPLCGARLEPA